MCVCVCVYTLKWKVHKEVYLFFCDTCFYWFHFLQDVVMDDGGVAFDLYSGYCFHKVVIISTFTICVWEFSDYVN